jgi:hypothetical protein
MKIIVCAVLLIALCFVPAGGLPETQTQPLGGDITVSVTVVFGGEAGSAAPDDEAMLLEPNSNIDPKMLINVEADNDPGFFIDRDIKIIIR